MVLMARAEGFALQNQRAEGCGGFFYILYTYFFAINFFLISLWKNPPQPSALKI